MSDPLYTIMTMTAVALVTWLCRGLPYLIFTKSKNLPPIINYLGKVFPSSIMIILVVYCLKGTQFNSFPYGLPELISIAAVIVLQVWRRNILISMLLGTICYMFLTRMPIFI